MRNKKLINKLLILFRIQLMKN